MKYIPDTCDYDNRLDKELYKIFQFKYREGFTNYLSKYIDFDKLCNEINKVKIPKIDDKDYNFYHSNSAINSDYLFIRNNVHIENLSDEELSYLREIDGENIDKDNDFFKKTYSNVMFEDGEYVSYGLYPNDSNIKKSKAIVFEFAYDQKKCEDLEQLNSIKELIDKVFLEIKESLDKANIQNDFFVYKCIPETFSYDDLKEETLSK